MSKQEETTENKNQTLLTKCQAIKTDGYHAEINGNHINVFITDPIDGLEGTLSQKYSVDVWVLVDEIILVEE